MGVLGDHGVGSGLEEATMRLEHLGAGHLGVEDAVLVGTDPNLLEDISLGLLGVVPLRDGGVP